MFNLITGMCFGSLFTLIPLGYYWVYKEDCKHRVNR